MNVEAVEILKAIEAALNDEVYEAMKAQDFDAPDDAEYTVNITAGLWRRLTRYLNGYSDGRTVDERVNVDSLLDRLRQRKDDPDSWLAAKLIERTRFSDEQINSLSAEILSVDTMTDFKSPAKISSILFRHLREGRVSL